MTILNRIASNWSFQEREKLNNNWTIIESYLSKLQGQINILTGDVDVQELVAQINDILNQGNIVIADLETALQDATTVITNAQNATTEANNAAQDALNAINDMQAFINQFGNAETYDNSKLYQVNNLVEFDGSGYICIKDTQGNPPPTLATKRNEWWQLFAQKGVDGTGAVSKVAGKSPELDGNVPLTAHDVGAASIAELDEHLKEIFSESFYVTREMNMEGVQIVTLPSNRKPSAIRFDACLIQGVPFSIGTWSERSAEGFNGQLSMFKLADNGMGSGSYMVAIGSVPGEGFFADMKNLSDTQFELHWRKIGNNTLTGTVAVLMTLYYHGKGGL